MEVDALCNIRPSELLFKSIEHLSALVQRERVREGKVSRLSRSVAELVAERHEKLLSLRAAPAFPLVIISPCHLLWLLPWWNGHQRVVDLAWDAPPSLGR